MWNIGLGVRYENIIRNYFSGGVKQDDVSKRYSNLFPNLSMSWNKGNWFWQLNVNEKIHRPSYRQLGNFMQFDNRFLYEGGNPALQPEKVFNVEAMWWLIKRMAESLIIRSRRIIMTRKIMRRKISRSM